MNTEHALEHSPVDPWMLRDHANLDPRCRQDHGNVGRDGDLLVVPREGAELPDRCVQCNAPADMYRQITEFETPMPLIWLTFLLSPYLYFIARGFTSSFATVEIPLCQHHRYRRSRGRLIQWGGLAAGCVAFLVAVWLKSVAGMGLVALATLAAFLGGSLHARASRALRMNDKWVWLKVGRAFLDTIPPMGDRGFWRGALAAERNARHESSGAPVQPDTVARIVAGQGPGPTRG